jgi:hypothetical protein
MVTALSHHIVHVVVEVVHDGATDMTQNKQTTATRIILTVGVIAL